MSQTQFTKEEPILFAKVSKSETRQVESDFWHLFKEKLCELLLASTSHGLPSAVRTKHTSMRVMWLVCFFLSTCVCSYVILTSLFQYLEFAVITKVRVVNEFQSEFPRVLICNANEFTTDYALQFLMDPAHKFSRLSAERLDDSDYVSKHHAKAMEYISYNFSRAQKKSLGYSLEETLLSCKFGGAKCSPNDFEWIYNEYNGNCFVFNSGRNMDGAAVPLKRVKDPGQFAGLQMEMFVGVSSAQLERFSVSGFTGAKVFLGNNSFKSVYEDTQEILISSGALTNIAVQRMHVRQKERPYSSCTLDSDSVFYKKIVGLNFRYAFNSLSHVKQFTPVHSGLEC